MKKGILFILMLFCNFFVKSQTVKLLTSSQKKSLRGLSVVSDKVVWASGSAGTVVLSIDSGNTWKWTTVKGYEKTEFRDIEAFDDKTAIIMGIDTPAIILKTIDAGETWKLVYKNNEKGMFLDAMDFANEKEGIVIGDPIENLFFIAKTEDGGNTWQDRTNTYKMLAEKGEAAFASSGTNIRKTKNGSTIFVSGGLSSNLYFNFNKIPLPILQGKESSGANSIAAKNNKHFIVVGGDFSTKDSSTKNCFITKNAGKKWTPSIAAPTGYRSCIEYMYKKTWVTCGINGVDITMDDGKHFKQISTIGFHACRIAKNGNSVFFSGGDGRIGKLIF
jgi:photosystem II stability/assembly factor-like uncharacterized protein